MADTKAFKGFSDTQMKRIAKIMGYGDGPVSGIKAFINSSPALQAKFKGMEEKARMKFAVGGAVSGGMPPLSNIVEAFNAANQANVTEQPQAVEQFNAANQANVTGQPQASAAGAEQYSPTARPDPNQAYDPNQPRTGSSAYGPAQGLGAGSGTPYNADQPILQFGAEGYNEGELQPTTATGASLTSDDGYSGGPYVDRTQSVPAQSVPREAESQIQADYQNAYNQQQQTLRAEAPPAVLEAERLMQDYESQLQEKYQQRGLDLNQKIEAKFKERYNPNATREEQAAFQAELTADPDYMALQNLDRDAREDPLSVQMRNNQQIWAAYMDEGLQTWKTANPSPSIGDAVVRRGMTPGVPDGGEYVAGTVNETDQQFIDQGTGEVAEGTLSADLATADTSQAEAVTPQDTATYNATETQAGVREVTDETQAAQGTVSDEAQVDAQTMDATRTEVGTIPAAQIEKATQVEKPQSRTLQEGELVESTFNAREASAFAEEIQAAQANPSARATVQGQLDDLMGDFDGGQTPAWAAGALRNATAQMAARGLSSSSLAGQAMIQAAMESALPIAMTDAATFKDFEMQNLSNRQSRAMLAAEQRANFIGREFDMEFQAQVMNASKISDIANINFNAEQQVALENARLAQTANLANLNNRQALVMAEAAQVSNIELTNLNNRQQAAVQNAQAFLQTDLTNLSNEQQTEMFRGQSLVQSLLSDAAADNASKQFNASSENQTEQFFASLGSQVSQFNAAQSNGMSQFNAEQSNSVEKFNTELTNLREQFNSQNQLIIEQSAVQWRRQIATLDSAAVNTSNQFNATSILDISNTAYANLWQQQRDSMEWAWTSTENERDRIASSSELEMQIDLSKWATRQKEDADESAAWGGFVFDMVRDWM